jgi:4a-hydroxytetrahydrobiopterin dehydratase
MEGLIAAAVASCFTWAMEYTAVTPEEFTQLEGVGDWRFVLGSIHATFTAPGYLDAADLVSTIARIAEDHAHHPDLELRYPGRVHVLLTTHATQSLTTLDVDVAREISTAAAAIGATSDPSGARALEIGIDAMDADRIRPFWAAVLGYRERGGQLVDPAGIGPSVWFQEMTEPRPDRNRIHVDVSVPHDVAEQRVSDALDAGGVLVSDAHARAWWVLADAEGNEACISTWQDR